MLILPTSAAKVLYSRIEEFRAEGTYTYMYVRICIILTRSIYILFATGVPKNLLKELPEIHSHLLKKGDSTKKVYCKSSKPDEYQDGTTAPFAYIP